MKKRKRRTQYKKRTLSHVFRYVIAAVGIASIAGIVFFSFKITSSVAICANSLTCLGDLSGRVEKNAVGVFEGYTVVPPVIDFHQKLFLPNVLGDTVLQGYKHIYVDLSTQTLTAYQGDALVLTTRISSGKWFPTPPGEYTIWIKVRSQKMSGGTGADYYYLPNVPYVMFFYNKDVAKSRGFSLHGAYWHNNFGYPMSHGCVNMRITDAEALYRWADPATEGNVTSATTSNPGTQISIIGSPPRL